MKPTDSRPRKKRAAPQGMAVPAPYLRQLVELGCSWGLSEEDILRGTRIPAELLHKRGARIAGEQAALLGFNMIRLGGRPGFGFELGLNVKLTSHGSLGYAFLSAATLGEALAIAIRYVRQQWSVLELRMIEDGDRVAIELVDHFPLGPFRALVHEAALTLMWSHGCFVTGTDDRDTELCFPWPEPDYYALYRDRLPTVRWSQPETSIRVAAQRLDRRLVSADPVAASHALEEADRELAAVGETPEHFVERVRGLLRPAAGGFPPLEAVAASLFLSDRSLKRRLQASGTSFQKLLNEALQREALRLMLNPALDLQQIATRLGYQDPETFTRAFRRWTGSTPSAYRQQLNAGGADPQNA